jgi:gluconate 2-dehydrogenase gamma chain
LRSHVELYRAGLNALESEAQASTGASFVNLNSDVQGALLSRIEVGDVTTRWPIDPATFFRNVVNHTIEGFYSDPANGGNRNAVSWHMIGFQVRA